MFNVPGERTACHSWSVFWTGCVMVEVAELENREPMKGMGMEARRSWGWERSGGLVVSGWRGKANGLKSVLNVLKGRVRMGLRIGGGVGSFYVSGSDVLEWLTVLDLATS